MRFRNLLLAGGAALVATAPASAAVITLYNTGVDAAGTVQSNGAAELHYTAVGANGFAPRVATSANGFPIPPWLGDNTTSAWIGPVSGDLSAPAGNYTYRTTFTLLRTANAQIAGRWATDDPGIDVLINGVSTGQTASGFTSWTDFAVTSGFVVGENTLDFVVQNGGGPTGLRVELSGTGSVPEPATWGLMVLGFGLVGAAARRRRTTVLA